MGSVFLLVNPVPGISINKKSNKSDSKKNWTEEIEKDLIGLIKEEKALWDIDNELNRKRSYRYIAWNKIAIELKALWPNNEHLFTVVTCMKKYSNLKKYYKRELIKVKTLSNYVCRWCHFGDMKFLEDNIFTKQESIPTSHGSPVIIQLPDGKRKSLKNVEENLNISSLEGKTKTSTIGNPMCNQGNDNETTYASAEFYSDLEEMSTSTIGNPMCNQGKDNETSYASAESYSYLEKLSSKPKKKKLTPQQMSASPDLINNAPKHHQMTKMTHDEAFGNFVIKDLGKIPEGKLKEQLRFKIVELIHQCKMDTPYLRD